MTTGINGVNRRLIAAGHPEVTLVKGEGYFYYVFDNIVDNKEDLVDNQPQVYQTESIMVCNFRDQMFDHWVRDGIDFAKRVKEANQPEPWQQLEAMPGLKRGEVVAIYSALPRGLGKSTMLDMLIRKGEL